MFYIGWWAFILFIERMKETKTTEINCGIMLTEYTDGLLFGTDALLLSHFVKGGKHKKGVDIGAGSGPISLILLAEDKAAYMTGVEIQPEYALLSEMNANQNGFASRYKAVCGDANNIKELLNAETADFVVSNPPFMKAAAGKHNLSLSKSIARHEEYLPPNSLCAAAAYLLKYGGSFYVVYRPERLCTLISELKNHALEPKRICFAGTNGKVALVLVEAKKGGAEGADITFMNI